MTDSIVLMTDERTQRSFDAMSAEDAGYILKGLLKHAAGEDIDYSEWTPMALAVYPLIEGQVDRMTQLRDKNRENGSRGGRPAKTESVPADSPTETETKPNQNPTETQQEPEANPEKAPVPVPEPEQKEKPPYGGKEKSPRFVPPTEEEVAEYCREHGYDINPSRFIAYYESKGWVVGRNAPMKDWRAAIRQWVTTDNRAAPVKSKFNFDERKTDYDAMLRERDGY